MRFTLYVDTLGRIAGMTEGGAMVGAQPYADFIKDFDGDVPLLDFEVPPEPIPVIDADPAPVLTPDQTHQLARVVYNTALETAIHANGRYLDLVSDIRDILAPLEESEDSGDYIRAIAQIGLLLPKDDSGDDPEGP